MAGSRGGGVGGWREWRAGGCGEEVGEGVVRWRIKRLFTHGTPSQRTAKEPGACAVFSDGSLAPNHVEKKREGEEEGIGG